MFLVENLLCVWAVRLIRELLDVVLKKELERWLDSLSFRLTMDCTNYIMLANTTSNYLCYICLFSHLGSSLLLPLHLLLDIFTPSRSRSTHLTLLRWLLPVVGLLLGTLLLVGHHDAFEVGDARVYLIFLHLSSHICTFSKQVYCL